MTATIEPGDDIQVFIKGTGACLWGFIQPESGEGNIVLTLDVEPLPDTIALVKEQGVEFEEGHELLIGTRVFIPKVAVDVIFGDERHDEEIAS